VTAAFASATALLAVLALLSGVAPRWPLTIAAVAVAMTVVWRLTQPDAADPALLALLLVAVAKPVALRRWPVPSPHLVNTQLRAIVVGVAVVAPALLVASPSARPIQTVLAGLALLGLHPDRRIGLLAIDAAVAAAAVGGDPVSVWSAAVLGGVVLAARRWPWLPTPPLAGLLVATLGLALEPSRTGAALMLAGAWLAAGIWPLGRWTRGVVGWRFGGAILAVVQAAALFAALRGATQWDTGATSLRWVGALGVGVSGVAALLAATPVRRLAADAAVQAALVACAFGTGGTAVVYGLIHLLVRAPLLALGTRAPPPATAAVLRWCRAGLPVFATFWTTLTIVMDAGYVQPWLLTLLIPGLLAYLAATWRSSSAGRAAPAWVAWLAMAPAGVIGIVWTTGWMPNVVALLPWT